MIGRARCQSRPLRAGSGAEWSALAAAPPPRGRAGGAEPRPQPPGPPERGRPEGGGDAAAAAAAAMEAKPADPLLCDSLILWVSGAGVLPPLGPLEGGEEAPAAGSFPSILVSVAPSPPAEQEQEQELWVGRGLPGTRCSLPAKGARSTLGVWMWWLEYPVGPSAALQRWLQCGNCLGN